MPVNIAINGYGRIGRNVLRALYEGQQRTELKIVAINDLGDAGTNAHLTRYDSAHGPFPYEIQVKDDQLVVDGDLVHVCAERDPSKLPWAEMDVDVVMECTGLFNSKEKASAHLNAGASKVIISAPAGTTVDATIVYGVNQDDLDIDNDFLIASSICDANAVAPVLNILNNKFGIEHGFLTTLHPWLSYQNLVDGPSRSFAYPGTIIDNFTLGRASINSLIPKTTSAIRASTKVLDFLNNKFQSLSFRVPTSIVSTADISVKLTNKISKSDIINIVQACPIIPNMR